MADTATRVQRPFTVLRVVLETGERLPCLVDSATWLPVRVGTRWAVRRRRYRVQSSTLVSNLRALCRLYTWANQTAGFDLDDFLTAGKLLDSRQVESLASELRSNIDGSPTDTGAFDHRLSVVEDFLRWALDSSNRGGGHPLTIARLSAERGRLHDIFRSLRIGGQPANRIQPLEEHQIKAIRVAIGPQDSSPTAWTFPDAFAPHARLRNWLMFEVALELGIRRGELLKLRLDSLPRGANDGVLILRRPDDPNDSRLHEPAVKTAERAIPASRFLLAAIRAYLTYPPPLGRVSGRSPYLFVARSGEPLSSDRADDVIVAIGRHAGVTPLSWHRLRHTWAETMAEVLSDRPNGMDRLVYLGGWKNSFSASRYIQRAIARQATASVREYQRKLYELESRDE
jgi:integrase